MTASGIRPIAPHYHPPEDLTDTVFDPHDDTFGPIMAAIQSGDFARAARLLHRLAIHSA
jgi:hypothetical protein